MDKFNELNNNIFRTIDDVIKEYLRKLSYDKTLFGQVTEIIDNKVNVKFNNEIYKCRIKQGITILVGDVVIVKQIDYPDCKYYVDGKLK
jgi:translation initiation factor IF-1